MRKYRFGDLVRDTKGKVDRNNNPYEYYVAGDHMDSEDLTIHRRGRFASDDVGPAFIREFKKGQVLYGSRRTYLKKVAVADFDGVTSNTTFVLETKDENVMPQSLLPFIMLTDRFTNWSIGKSKGSTNPYILFSDLENFEVELPGIEKQRELAAVLWQIFRLKERYNDILRKSDELVQSQFIEMFADMPKGRLADIAIITMGQSPDGKTYNDNACGMPFFQGKTEFGDMYIGNATTWTTSPTRTADINDILMSVRAPVGSTNIATQQCCLGRGLAGIKPIEGKSTTMFILYSMRSIEDSIEKMGVGSTFKAINKDVVHGIPIPIASIELQDKFVAFAEQLDKSKFTVLQMIAMIAGKKYNTTNRHERRKNKYVL